MEVENSSEKRKMRRKKTKDLEAINIKDDEPNRVGMCAA